MITDEVFLSYEKDFNWCAPLTEFAGFEDGQPRDIKVILWYMEAPPKLDPSLPEPDPHARPSHSPRAQDVFQDGSAQVERELNSRQRFVHVGREVEATAATWA